LNEAIWVAVIGCIGTCVSAITVFIVQMRKLRLENNARNEENLKAQQKQVDDLKESINKKLDDHRKEYISEIDKVKCALNDTNGIITSMQASYQTTVATVELRLEHMTSEFADMKTEVREHNNFARRLPVVEEQIKVANHRIEDLERKENSDDGK